MWYVFDFAPVIEIDHQDAFITKNIFELVQTGNTARLPILIGINSEEYIEFFPGICNKDQQN